MYLAREENMFCLQPFSIAAYLCLNLLKIALFNQAYYVDMVNLITSFRKTLAISFNS